MAKRKTREEDVEDVEGSDGQKAPRPERDNVSQPSILPDTARNPVDEGDNRNISEDEGDVPTEDNKSEAEPQNASHVAQVSADNTK